MKLKITKEISRLIEFRPHYRAEKGIHLQVWFQDWHFSNHPANLPSNHMLLLMHQWKQSLWSKWCCTKNWTSSAARMYQQNWKATKLSCLNTLRWIRQLWLECYLVSCMLFGNRPRFLRRSLSAFALSSGFFVRQLVSSWSHHRPQEIKRFSTVLCETVCYEPLLLCSTLEFLPAPVGPQRMRPDLFVQDQRELPPVHLPMIAIPFERDPSASHQSRLHKNETSKPDA